MQQEFMCLLNTCCYCVFNNYLNLCEPFACATVSSKKCDRMYACFLRCHKSASYILTLTAGRKGEEDISLLPEGTHLPGEYLLKAIVVADGCHVSAIGCE